MRPILKWGAGAEFEFAGLVLHVASAALSQSVFLHLVDVAAFSTLGGDDKIKKFSALWSNLSKLEELAKASVQDGVLEKSFRLRLETILKILHAQCNQACNDITTTMQNNLQILAEKLHNFDALQELKSFAEVFPF